MLETSLRWRLARITWFKATEITWGDNFLAKLKEVFFKKFNEISAQHRRTHCPVTIAQTTSSPSKTWSIVIWLTIQLSTAAATQSWHWVPLRSEIFPAHFRTATWTQAVVWFAHRRRCHRTLEGSLDRVGATRHLQRWKWTSRIKLRIRAWLKFSQRIKALRICMSSTSTARELFHKPFCHRRCSTRIALAGTLISVTRSKIIREITALCQRLRCQRYPRRPSDCTGRFRNISPSRRHRLQRFSLAKWISSSSSISSNNSILEAEETRTRTRNRRVNVRFSMSRWPTCNFRHHSPISLTCSIKCKSCSKCNNSSFQPNVISTRFTRREVRSTMSLSPRHFLRRWTPARVEKFKRSPTRNWWGWPQKSYRHRHIVTWAEAPFQVEAAELFVGRTNHRQAARRITETAWRCPQRLIKSQLLRFPLLQAFSSRQLAQLLDTTRPRWTWSIIRHLHSSSKSTRFWRTRIIPGVMWLTPSTDAMSRIQSYRQRCTRRAALVHRHPADQNKSTQSRDPTSWLHRRLNFLCYRLTATLKSINNSNRLITTSNRLNTSSRIYSYAQTYRWVVQCHVTSEITFN